MHKLLTFLFLTAALSAYSQVTLISEDFESDTPGWLFTGFKYSYTDGFIWNSTLASPNNLSFYHGSGTGHWIAEDPLDPQNQVFYIDGFANIAQDGTRGVYMMKLDLTGNGAYSAEGGLVTVRYSFRMMRVAAPDEEEDSPTDWQVAWLSWYDNPDGTIMEPGSGKDAKTVVKNFRTSGNADTWVTVEGFFLADLNRVDTSDMLNTMIHIGANDGGFVSTAKGLYYLDDVMLSVSQGEVVETPMWAGYEIDEETGNVDTGSWMGMLHVDLAPFIYSYNLNSWLYIQEDSVAEAGSWVYVHK